MSMNKKKRYIKKKNVSGLKKWNKIVSIIVKEYKKENVDYDLGEVRKLASKVYAKDFKEVAPSRLRIGKVKETTKEVLSKDDLIEVNAKQVRDNPKTSYWFLAEENFESWYLLGGWVQDFVNTYPNIPVMIVTKQNVNSPLIVQGAIGTYEGGIFQKWVEDIRESLVNAENSDEWQYIDDEDEEIDTFMGDAFFINNQWYAVWFEKSIDLAKDLPPILDEPQELDIRTQIIIDKKEEDIDDTREKRKIEKKRTKVPKKPTKSQKTPLPKTKDKKPKAEDKRSKEYRDGKNKSLQTEAINKRIEGLREDIKTIKEELKDGFTTKKEAKKQVSQIREDISVLSKKLAKGGNV